MKLLPYGANFITESQTQKATFLDTHLMMLQNKVGVSKKSLDDYLLQLRFGKKLGFDFEKYKNERVGVLRKFVKQNKSRLK